MERRSLWVGCVAVGLLVAGGCNSADSSGTAPSSGVSATSDMSPDKVVCTFLEAVRTGNDAQASLMLTELARQETQKHELVVAPPGSDTAKFEVGDVEIVSKDELAHVASKWTDIGEDGQPHSDEIVWALRRDPQGWRIAGMATKIFPNEPPLLLDFEQPEEMMRQQQLAEQEMQRRASGGAAQAQAVQAPPQGQNATPAPQGPAAQAQKPAAVEKPAGGNVLRQ